MFRLKSKLTEIDRYETDGITTVIYFDEYYQVNKFEYSRDFSYIASYDEFDDPSLKDYRLVLEASATNKGC